MFFSVDSVISVVRKWATPPNTKEPFIFKSKWDADTCTERKCGVNADPCTARKGR